MTQNASNVLVSVLSGLFSNRHEKSCPKAVHGFHKTWRHMKVKVEVTQSSLTLQPHGLYSPWSPPGRNTTVGNCSLLQGIFPTQGSNPGLPHWSWILYQLSQRKAPEYLEWVAYPFSRGSFLPRNRTWVSCIAGGFFTNWAIRETQKDRWSRTKTTPVLEPSPDKSCQEQPSPNWPTETWIRIGYCYITMIFFHLFLLVGG